MLKSIIISIVCIIFASGCVSVSGDRDSEVFWNAKKNFHYVTDSVQYGKSDKWVRFPSVEKRFNGDCEDFAFTMQAQIGGDVWHVIIPSGEHHAILLKGGVIYDNMMPYPVLKSDYSAQWLRVMVFKG